MGSSLDKPARNNLGEMIVCRPATQEVVQEGVGRDGTAIRTMHVILNKHVNFVDPGFSLASCFL